MLGDRNPVHAWGHRQPTNLRPSHLCSWPGASSPQPFGWPPAPAGGQSVTAGSRAYWVVGFGSPGQPSSAVSPAPCAGLCTHPAWHAPRLACATMRAARAAVVATLFSAGQPETIDNRRLRQSVSSYV